MQGVNPNQNYSCIISSGMRLTDQCPCFCHSGTVRHAQWQSLVTNGYADYHQAACIQMLIFHYISRNPLLYHLSEEEGLLSLCRLKVSIKKQIGWRGSVEKSWWLSDFEVVNSCFQLPYIICKMRMRPHALHRIFHLIRKYIFTNQRRWYTTNHGYHLG